MSRAQCSGGPAFDELVDYWFDELGTAASSALEEHVFACGVCAGRLGEIAAIGEGVKRVVASGAVATVMTGAFVERLKRSGVRVREYRIRPNGSVLCTIAPEDDLVVAHLRAPLEGVGRLDALLHDPSLPAPVRLEDLPFEAGAGEIVLAPEAASLRRLGAATQRVELVAVDDGRERRLGDYTFNHAPYRAD